MQNKNKKPKQNKTTNQGRGQWQTKFPVKLARSHGNTELWELIRHKWQWREVRGKGGCTQRAAGSVRSICSGSPQSLGRREKFMWKEQCSVHLSRSPWQMASVFFPNPVRRNLIPAFPSRPCSLPGHELSSQQVKYGPAQPWCFTMLTGTVSFAKCLSMAMFTDTGSRILSTWRMLSHVYQI